jgi:hypothetical protein
MQAERRGARWERESGARDMRRNAVLAPILCIYIS